MTKLLLLDLCGRLRSASLGEVVYCRGCPLLCDWAGVNVTFRLLCDCSPHHHAKWFLAQGSLHFVSEQLSRLTLVRSYNNSQARDHALSTCLWNFGLARSGTSARKRLGVHGASVQACLERITTIMRTHVTVRRPDRSIGNSKELFPRAVVSQLAHELLRAVGFSFSP